MDAAITTIRRFNRIHTQRVGALEDRFLSRDRPLGEARLLWEIGVDGAADVRSLRERLDLDAGYTSRLLRSLERAGLIVLEPDRKDRRVRRVRLTRKGRAERAVLDRRSNDLAGSLIEPLSESQRTKLVEALGVAERLLTAGLVTLDVEDPASADAERCMNAYFAELDARFENGFDPARSITADPSELVEPAGVLLLARLRGAPVGSGAARFHGTGRAEIKRMWVDASARGLGVGRRILRELENRVGAHGITTVQLETNRSLAEAISLYRSSGYHEIEPYNNETYAHHWFEKRLDKRA